VTDPAAAAWTAPSECPACGGILRGWRLVAPGEPDGEPVRLLRCVACGTAVTAAPPEPAAHDSGSYGTAKFRLARAVEPILTAFDRHRLWMLRRGGVEPGARVLDAGAGRGRFVATARAAGYDASGLEPSERGVRAAREVYGLELLRAGIEDAPVQAGSYDAVTLWHVLEHVEDPGAALDLVGAWVRPGGVLLVGVPNLASLQARAGRGRWFHLDVPRHRTHFTPRGLELLLDRHGFTAERTHHVLAEHNPFGLWQSLVPTRTPSYAYHLLKRNTPADPRDLAISAAALPLAPVAALAEAGAGLARRGGTIAVLARRR
jgi:SAM-dependent methyltransferase